MSYDFSKIETKWRERWGNNPLYSSIQSDSLRGDPSKEYRSWGKGDGVKKYYCLDMFPYPSGSGLHVGHWRGYVLSDIYARIKWLEGYNILHPMGWDAFGLPAENDAIKKGIHPKVGTAQNIANFKKQLHQIGAFMIGIKNLIPPIPIIINGRSGSFCKCLKLVLLMKTLRPLIGALHV